MNTQPFFAVARQVLGVISTVMGILTQSVTALHLPVAVSGVLVAFGPVILALEHFVADPSTGNPVTTTTTTTATPVVPAAPSVPATPTAPSVVVAPVPAPPLVQPTVPA